MHIRFTLTMKWMLGLMLGMFVIQHAGDRFFGTSIFELLALIPLRLVNDLHLWQIVTYLFVHGDVTHLILNALMLVFIGAELEQLWGRSEFLRYYFACGIFSGVVYLLLQALVIGNLHVPMVGASGAIYGLLTAYGIFFGERVMLFMLLFPMKAKHFIWVLASVEFLTLVFSANGGLSSLAHLAGMGGGFVYLWIRAYAVARHKRAARGGGSSGKPQKKKRRSGGSHLKLIVNNDFEHDDDGSKDPKTWH